MAVVGEGRGSETDSEADDSEAAWIERYWKVKAMIPKTAIIHKHLRANE